MSENDVVKGAGFAGSGASDKTSTSTESSNDMPTRMYTPGPSSSTIGPLPTTNLAMITSKSKCSNVIYRTVRSS